MRTFQAQLRGALRGTSAPVTLSGVAKLLGLDTGGGAGVLAALTDELLQVRCVMASCTTWTAQDDSSGQGLWVGGWVGWGNGVGVGVGVSILVLVSKR